MKNVSLALSVAVQFRRTQLLFTFISFLDRTTVSLARQIALAFFGNPWGLRMHTLGGLDCDISLLTSFLLG